jgi:hypothetical protein
LTQVARGDREGGARASTRCPRAGGGVIEQGFRFSCGFRSK